MMAWHCKVCNTNSEAQTIQVAERMFGRGELFSYSECPACGTVALIDPPKDMALYYPNDYYSFGKKATSLLERLKDGIISYLKAKRIASIVSPDFISDQLLMKYPNQAIDALKSIKPEKNLHILDVGCGSGELILGMRKFGYKHAFGIDPFIKQDIRYKNQPCILKKDISEIAGQWDLIMLHHAFEHLDAPHEIMKQLAALLRPGGKLLIRIPTVSSEAFKHYREHWVQFDAPRHIFLHSHKGMKILGDLAGLELIEFKSDSTAFQSWGSELYRKGVSLVDPETAKAVVLNQHFTSAELTKMDELALKWNSEGSGDQGAWLFKKR